MCPGSTLGIQAVGPLELRPPAQLGPLGRLPGYPGHCLVEGGLSPIRRLSCISDRILTSSTSCRHPDPTSPQHEQAATACCPAQ
jgi:hypothetical protein